MSEKRQFNDNELLNMMQRAGIRPSLQRIAVLSFVANRRTHPSAEEIYTALATTFPTMSRTTVYNSLHALAGAGVLRELEIESGNMRYDLALQPDHGHFICRRCGKIFDTVMPDNIGTEIPPEFHVDCIEIAYKGLCPDCNQHQQI